MLGGMMHSHEEMEAGNPHLTCSQPEMTIKNISLMSCNAFLKEQCINVQEKS